MLREDASQCRFFHKRSRGANPVLRDEKPVTNAASSCNTYCTLCFLSLLANGYVRVTLCSKSLSQYLNLHVPSCGINHCIHHRMRDELNDT